MLQGSGQGSGAAGLGLPPWLHDLPVHNSGSPAQDPGRPAPATASAGNWEPDARPYLLGDVGGGLWTLFLFVFWKKGKESREQRVSPLHSPRRPSPGCSG